jgi:hypothetical protein
MVDDVNQLAYGSFPSRKLGEGFGINYIPWGDMIVFGENKQSNCWDFMDCPENLRRDCWVYRLNFGKQCWNLKEKARREFNWNNTGGCFNCKFYDHISRKIIK